MALNSEVGAYLERAAAKPIRYGKHDCLLTFIGDWILAQTGLDPAAPYRGRYSTRIGALRLITRAGGVVSLLDAGLAAVGIERTDDPLTGDVGAVAGLTASGIEICGAIRLGNRWAGVWQDGGVFVAPGEHLAAWRV